MITLPTAIDFNVPFFPAGGFFASLGDIQLSILPVFLSI
jgi:hypothetical protein